MEGKNNYGLILREVIISIERKLKIEFDLKNVLNRDELCLVYQPEVDLKTREIRAAESLLGWEHPELGNISPEEFISIVEETSIINKIGKWVIQEATRQAKEWHDKGLTICLAVNISYVQLRDEFLVRDVIAILERTNFVPAYFIIEITESLMKDLDYAKLITKDLKKYKTRIAIDDFGTGYTSFSVLGNMENDTNKIIERLHNRGLSF